jgi:hypothetical protein
MLTRKLRELEESIIANGRVEEHELKLLEELLYKDGRIERKEANFLAELRKRVPNRSPEFEKFFYKVLKDHVLANGFIGPREVQWLRKVLLSDHRVDAEERKFLRELKREASKFPKEFEKLYEERMNMPQEEPQEQHTSR